MTALGPRAKAALKGLLLMGAGLLCALPLLWPGSGLGLLTLAAPVLLVLSGVMLVRGLITGQAGFSAASLILTGLPMLAVGGCPWAYTGLIVGGSPGNEGAGMLGTLIFILVGVPGLIALFAGCILWVRERVG